MSIIQKIGFDFGFDPQVCKKCNGYCCSGKSGNIWVNQFEILQICSLLNTNPIEFIPKYLQRKKNRYSIIEKHTDNGFECIFLQPNATCSIYAARPRQCKTFPFWAEFKRDVTSHFSACPGVVSNQ